MPRGGEITKTRPSTIPATASSSASEVREFLRFKIPKVLARTA